ncbi:MAG TPA: hypothetical protein PLV83_01685 [Bacilli bacterium]|nr:hypothetical protein [Bacilli bacterium]
MRSFEKISFKQFKDDISDSKELYESIIVPKRQTSGSAGYDISVLKDYIIKPKEIVKIPTGIKTSMNEGEVLLLVVRSSMGFKYNLRLCNQVGVIDSDYYNNKENEGHIWIAVQNEGNSDITLNKGQRIVQGIFVNYLKVDDDDESKIRKGSTGSTDEEE